jgi:hypothetical protein
MRNNFAFLPQIVVALSLATCIDGASRWSGVPMAPPDPILGVGAAFKADPAADKVNLGIGAYRTSEGKPMVLKCVREAEKRICNDMTLDKEYLPMQVSVFLTPLSNLIRPILLILPLCLHHTHVSVDTWEQGHKPM